MISSFNSGETLKEINEIEEEIELPRYFTYVGSLQHVYMLALGEFDDDAYEMGDGS